MTARLLIFDLHSNITNNLLLLVCNKDLVEFRMQNPCYTIDLFKRVQLFWVTVTTRTWFNSEYRLIVM